jgi:ABC-type polysaccharide/polyol phosphate export permease
MIKNYSANYRCNDNIFTALAALYQQAVTFKWQIWLAVKKNIHQTYQQDVFGLFWSIAMPIIPMTIYMVLAYIKVFKTVDNMPFIYYISMGMLVWLLIATTIHTVTMAIKSEKSVLTTTNFPIFPTILSKLGEVLHDTAIRFVIVAIVVVWFQMEISFGNLILAFLSLIPAVIFALGLGMMLSILDVVIQDTRRILILVLRYGLFISSVIFPFPEWGIPGMLNKFNIFNTYVNATRDLLHHGSIQHVDVFIYSSIVSVVIFLIAAKLVYSMDYKIRAYL